MFFTLILFIVLLLLYNLCLYTQICIHFFSLQVPLQEETVVPKQNLSPLIVPACDRLPEKIAYFGASFRLTTELFCFWKKHKFLPFYVCQNPVMNQTAFIFLIYFYVRGSPFIMIIIIPVFVDINF